MKEIGNRPIFSSITDWHDHVRAGVQYVQTAGRGLNRPAVFNNELVFQLAAMGIEKMMVGVCQYHGQMPSDHTLSGLVDALAAVCPLDDDLADLVRRIATIDDMCTLEAERRTPPGDTEVQIGLRAGRRVAAFARSQVPWEKIETVAA